MVIRRTGKYRWKNGEGRLFYGCSRWPDCRSTHGAHPDGSPLGVPANGETKAARVEAHVAFDGMTKALGWNRTGAYVWLGRKLRIPEERIKEECHIARFDLNTCARVVEICQTATKGRVGK
ncbi:MAG: hypothetical protein IH577_04610 [Deltaproteobacteria bacterium]|nr:hypothetical protein [Deltaproteobacteria bacterium]